MPVIRPSSDLDALRRDLHDAYDGSPWHGSSIASVLEGVDAKTAARRAIPKGHTIWELLLHMTGWTREVTARVRGGSPKSPPEDWPHPNVKGGDEAWLAAKEDLAAAHKELETEVGSLRPDDLVRWIGDERDPALGAGVTVGTLLRGLLQHHAYHQGQIAILRKAVESGELVSGS
jgi:uncharacterized damage-inducible protein DinB